MKGGVGPYGMGTRSFSSSNQWVTQRDMKPTNIKIAPDGKVSAHRRQIERPCGVLTDSLLAGQLYN